MSESTIALSEVETELYNQLEDVKAKLKTSEAQLDICSWVLIALMRKHRYKQFPITRTLLEAIAKAELDLHADDTSVPGQLIITIEPKVKADAEESDTNEGRDPNVLGSDSGAPVEEQPGLPEGSTDTGGSADGSAGDEPVL